MAAKTAYKWIRPERSTELIRKEKLIAQILF